MVVFGDLHLDWKSARTILREARELGIEKALTLGDELRPFANPPKLFNQLFQMLRDFRDEAPNRELICITGDKSTHAPEDMLSHYVRLYEDHNLMAIHNGDLLPNNKKNLIENYSGLEPLVIFHGHSHSMGIHSKYRWLKDGEMVYYLKRGTRKQNLQPRKVYWVNPGGSYSIDSYTGAANFAVYDPNERTVTLRTIRFERRGR